MTLSPAYAHKGNAKGCTSGRIKIVPEGRPKMQEKMVSKN